MALQLCHLLPLLRHQAVINAAYELPFGVNKPLLSSLTGWKEKLVSGWSITGIETAQTGLPFTPQLGFNPATNGDSRNPVRPSRNPTFNGSVITGNPNQYFNPVAFIVPTP